MFNLLITKIYKNFNQVIDIKMAKWKCNVCGYIYDEDAGDPDSGIDPGTKFEDIPDDWSCPVCGATKGDPANWEKLPEEE